MPLSHVLAGIALPMLLAACTPAPEMAQAVPAVPIAAPDPGAGPDDDAPNLRPDGYHGNWRLVAADDPNGQALMALTIQSSTGEPEGSGDYLLHQPFCDAVDGRPITGTTDCELIGQGAAFDRVQATPERIVLTFHPTADGAEHRLELRRDGERLAGDYVAEAIRLHVIAERTVEGLP